MSKAKGNNVNELLYGYNSGETILLVLSITFVSISFDP